MKAILIDAMHTIWVSKFQKDRYRIYRSFIKKTLGVKLSLNLVKEVYLEKRSLLIQKEEGHREKWIVINSKVLETLLPNIPKAEIIRASEELTDLLLSSSLWMVKRDTRLFLKQAREKGFKIIIASNNEVDRLNDLINHSSIKRFIHSAYASSGIGFEKPDPRFFSYILEKEGLKPEDCVMIGDNPENDVVAPEKLGIKGVLYDPNGEHQDFKGLRVARLTDVLRLAIFYFPDQFQKFLPRIYILPITPKTL